MEPLSIEHIAITPGTCGGKPRIAGHRIRVQDIVVMHEEMGQSPAEIVESLPTITLADVHAALAYYYDNHEMIRKQMADGEAFVAKMKEGHVSLLQQKLAELHAAGRPIPPGRTG